jgi:hypothetical protein
MNPTPACPKGIFEYRCEYWGIDLVCHFEYYPAEKGSGDSMGASYEPDIDEAMDAVCFYVAGTDVDILPITVSECVDFLERQALLAFKDNNA